MNNFKEEKDCIYADLPYNISADITAHKYTPCKNFIRAVSLDDPTLDYFKVSINKYIVGKYKTKISAMLGLRDALGGVADSIRG